MFKKYLGTATIVLVLLQWFNPSISDAQEDGLWHFAIPVYVWLPGMEGHVGARGTTIKFEDARGRI